MGATNNVGLVVDASKGRRKHVYFVGPFGARVSFASQQRRALNLIWALRRKGEWPKASRPRAVVIGGGIAGVTIAAALHLQGCAVRIFEGEGAILSLQSEAVHRFVHPTINFWPEAPLSWTTGFPFLDWYAASCPKIMESIQGYWNEWFDGEIADVVPNAVFTGFGRARGDTVTMRFRDRPAEEADIVFVATGFGRERGFDDPQLKSYWQEDWLDRKAAKPNFRCVVSGTGDGGLIDALRLTYPRFMVDELALKTLQLSDSKHLREAVSDIENEAYDVGNENRRSKLYFTKYTEVARDLPRKAKRLLAPLVTGKIPVRLIGKLDHPFEASSAPIHKLILAISLYENRIAYTKGTLIRDENGTYAIRRKNAADEVLEFDHLVVRHGAEPPLEGFLGKKAAKELQAKQRHIGDYLELEGYSDEEFFEDSDLAPGRASDPEEFAQRRADLARQILRDRFKTGLRVVKDGFQVVMDSVDRTEASHVFWKLPNDLFRIPLLPAERLSSPMQDRVGRT